MKSHKDHTSAGLYSIPCPINIKHGPEKLLASLISGTLIHSIALFKRPVHCDARLFFSTPAPPPHTSPHSLFLSHSSCTEHMQGRAVKDIDDTNNTHIRPVRRRSTNTSSAYQGSNNTAL